MTIISLHCYVTVLKCAFHTFFISYQNSNSNMNTNIKNKNKTAKHIIIYLNGLRTEYYKITLDPKRLSKWHHVLNEITNKINPYFGIVKKLYSADSGVTISSFSDLENNGTYVAAKNKKFQLLEGGYNIDDKKNYFEHYQAKQLNRSNRLKKLTYCRRDLTVIFVFNNGQDRNSPEKIVLTKEDLENWNQTLSVIALIIDMPYRTIKALYDSHGNKVCGPWELQHGASYIAVGHYEKFIPRNYKIRESTAELWKIGTPVIRKEKTEQCFHKHKAKSWKQRLEWKLSIEDLFDYLPLQSNNSPKRKKNKGTLCRCGPSSGSESSTANTTSIFIIPSDKCGRYRDSNSILKKYPPHNSYEFKNKQKKKLTVAVSKNSYCYKS